MCNKADKIVSEPYIVEQIQYEDSLRPLNKPRMPSYYNMVECRYHTKMSYEELEIYLYKLAAKDSL